MLKPTFLLLALACTYVHAESINIQDSHGQHTFSKIPQRVIALDWAAAENLIELGITPIAIADTKDYRIWVRRPALAEAIIDVGTRDAPNAERIAQLKPDLIIIGEQQAGIAEKLKPIAPLLVFNGYSKDHNNSLVARNIFKQIAKLFGKQALAEKKLNDLDQQFVIWREQIYTHFQNSPPPITTVRFNNTALAWVYGDNSMPQYTLEKLGLSAALPQAASQWGVTQKKVIELAKIGTGILLYFEPFAKKQQLFNAPLWQAMPFVRKQHVAALPSTWTYGGPLSLLYMGEAITEQLLSIQP